MFITYRNKQVYFSIMGDMSIEEARAKMIAKRFGGNKNGASTGGSGTARRKVKAVHKSSGGGE